MYDLHDRILHRTQNALWSSSTSRLDLKKQGPHFAAYTHNPLSRAALSVYISGTSAQQFDAYYETVHAPLHGSLNAQIYLSSI